MEMVPTNSRVASAKPPSAAEAILPNDPTVDTDDEANSSSISLEEEEADDETSSEDEEEDDEDDEEEGWMDTFRASWRQHCFAVFVAVVATWLSFYYQQLTFSQAHVSSKRVGRRALLQAAPTALENAAAMIAEEGRRVRQPHGHLLDYQRTSHISFCGSLRQFFDAAPLSDDHLSLMDFHVPDGLIDVMETHFRADWYRDDRYDQVLQSSTKNISWEEEEDDKSRQQSEITCMDTLKKDSTHHRFIKGITYYYKAPSIESMYRDHIQQHETASVKQKAPEMEAVQVSFPGFAAKFVNLSPKPILLHWDGRAGAPETRRLVGEMAPFEALTTATRPGESFYVSPVYDGAHALERWTVSKEDSVLYFEDPKETKALSAEEGMLYKMQKLNQEFAKHYLIHSGRTWLSHFPRAFPVHKTWRAEYFGQQHKFLSDYVDDEGVDREKTFTMEVASVSPRVFTIRNFLSSTECDTIREMALHQGMIGSTLYAGSLAKQQRDVSTRSSSNAWLARSTAAVTDQIYRRAAHLLQIDESLLEAPIDDDVDAQEHSIAESLQVIRYKEGEAYAPHHDWVLSSQRNRHQPTRFATILMYLNDDFEGGETVFPRAVNSQNHDGVRIEPEKGMAILFYNILPDGNLDDLSQHGSEPVTKGEKVRIENNVIETAASLNISSHLYHIFRIRYLLVCCQSLGVGSCNQLNLLDGLIRRIQSKYRHSYKIIRTSYTYRATGRDLPNATACREIHLLVERPGSWISSTRFLYLYRSSCVLIPSHPPVCTYMTVRPSSGEAGSNAGTTTGRRARGVKCRNIIVQAGAP